MIETIDAATATPTAGRTPLRNHARRGGGHNPVVCSFLRKGLTMADMMTDTREATEAPLFDELLRTLRDDSMLPEWPRADVQFTLNLQSCGSFTPSVIESRAETGGVRQELDIDRRRDVIECLRLLADYWEMLADYWEKRENETDNLREGIRQTTRNLADRDVGRVAKWLHEEGPWVPPFVRPEPSRTATKKQRHRIRKLTVQLYRSGAGEEQAYYLHKLGHSSADSLTHSQAVNRIAFLEAEVGALEW